MQAPKGNEYSKKLKKDDIKLKLKVYQDYCTHIAKGKSKRSWTYEKDGLSVYWETIENYIKKEPEVFESIHMKLAECKSFSVWEEIGVQMAMGAIKNPQPAVYQMIMRNKFGWDKDNHNKDQAKGAFNFFYEQVIKKGKKGKLK